MNPGIIFLSDNNRGSRAERLRIGGRRITGTLAIYQST